MAARYWRVTGITTHAAGGLRLTGAELWVDGVRSSFPVACSIAPSVGVGSDLSLESNTNVVGWSADTATAPGFFLVWDTLSDSTDLVGIKLRAAESRGAYPVALVVQSSSDMLNWITKQTYTSLIFPGEFTTSEFVYSVETYSYGDTFDTFDSASWSLSQASGTTGATGGVSGGALVATSYGSGGSYHGPVLTKILPAGLYDFDLTFSGVVVGNVANDLHLTYLFVLDDVGNTLFAWTMTDSWADASSDSGMTHQFNNGGASVGSVNASTFSGDVRLVRIGSVLTCYSGGVQRYSGPCVITPVKGVSLSFQQYTTYAVPALSVGGVSISGALGFTAYAMRSDPSGILYAPSPLLPLAQNPGASMGTSDLQFYDGDSLISDLYYAGPGKIAGTVFEKGSPSNIATRRKVRLHDERSGLFVQETWSDATTGAYQFVGIPLETRYTVIAYDHTGAYRGVIADGQFAERMQ